MDLSNIGLVFLLSLIAVGTVILFIIFSWGLVWKLLLSRFELLRAIFTDTDSNTKPSDKISSRHKRTKYQGSLVTTSSQPRRINNFKYN